MVTAKATTLAEWEGSEGGRRRVLQLRQGGACVVAGYDAEKDTWREVPDEKIEAHDLISAVLATKKKRAPSSLAELEEGLLSGVPIPPELRADDRFMRALHDWVKARSEKGARVTETVSNRLFGKVREFGVLAVTMALEKAAGAGWTGFFPEKEQVAASKVADAGPNMALNLKRLRGRKA